MKNAMEKSLKTLIKGGPIFIEDKVQPLLVKLIKESLF